MPGCINWFLETIAFPKMLRSQKVKLMACAQELGSNMIIKDRMGFSGTPSALLSRGLTCGFEKGADAQMILNTTSPKVMTGVIILWSVRSLLDLIRRQDPPAQALIDTALITLFTNEEVARYLLADGGLKRMQGVVFLDQYDRKMVLVRNTMNVVELARSGMSKAQRFSFQIHTTGMDIK